MDLEMALQVTIPKMNNTKLVPQFIEVERREV